jgi:hypothetical protein
MSLLEFFRRKIDDVTPKLSVAEGTSGYFFYHLSWDGGKTSLCKRGVMPTRIPVDTWGFKSHLHERYCAECEKKSGIKEMM